MNDCIDFWQKTSWFAVQTKSHSESLAANRVAKLDLEVFLPQIRPQQLVRAGVRRPTNALFPGYFFTRFSPLHSIHALRSTPSLFPIAAPSHFHAPSVPQT